MKNLVYYSVTGKVISFTILRVVNFREQSLISFILLPLYLVVKI